MHSPTPKLDQRFINWVRLSALPKFRKLWGIIDSDLKSGDVITVNVGDPPGHCLAHVIRLHPYPRQIYALLIRMFEAPIVGAGLCMPCCSNRQSEFSHLRSHIPVH